MEEEIYSLENNIKCMNPANCPSDFLIHNYESNCISANENANLINDILKSINFADNYSEENSIINVAGNMSQQFIYVNQISLSYLEYIRPLSYSLIGIFDVFVRNESVFQSLNFTFLGDDLKVVEILYR